MNNKGPKNNALSMRDILAADRKSTGSLILPSTKSPKKSDIHSRVSFESHMLPTYNKVPTDVAPGYYVPYRDKL